MTHHQLSPEQRRAVAQYVERRRMALNLTIKRAAATADLSERKWAQVEAGEVNHSERTLRLVALGLGESPRRVLEMAGLPYADADDDESPDSLAGLIRRIERLEPLPVQVSELRSQVRELVLMVRSVHHAPASPGT